MDSTVINKRVSVAGCKPHPRNYNTHDDAQVEDLRESLRQFGQVRSIVVQATKKPSEYLIVAGHGVTEAARREGIKALKADIIPAAWRPARVLAYLAADNELARRGNPDEAQLAALVAEVNAKEGAVLARLAAGEQKALDALLELANFNGSTDAAPLGGGIFSSDRIVDAAFDYFRKTGFPYRKLPVHVCMQEINKLACTDTNNLIHSDTAYHVADTYHPHRFSVVCNNLRSPVQSFNDDKYLKIAIKTSLDMGGSIGSDLTGTMLMVHSTQAAANFRPAFALYLYRRFAPAGAIVLDTSTGYGGRLVGFMASGLNRYIGIDPNKPTHEGNTRMANDLGFTDRVELYNLPAEDVKHSVVANRCDFAFTSPPYFSKEHYSDDDTQSWVRYKTGEDWRNGFLLPMMRLQYAALKDDSFAIVNIADVKLRNKIYPLVEWTISAGKECGFEFIRKEKFELTRRFGANMSDEVSFEPVLIFNKPERVASNGKRKARA